VSNYLKHRYCYKNCSW